MAELPSRGRVLRAKIVGADWTCRHPLRPAHAGTGLMTAKLMLGVEEIIGRRILLSDFMVDPTLPGLLRLVESPQLDKGQQLITFQSKGHSGKVVTLA